VLTLVPCSPGLTDSKQLREAEQGHYQQLKILPQVSTNLKGITWGSPPLAFLPVLHQYIVALDSSSVESRQISEVNSGVARILKLPGHRNFMLPMAVHRGV